MANTALLMKQNMVWNAIVLRKLNAILRQGQYPAYLKKYIQWSQEVSSQCQEWSSYESFWILYQVESDIELCLILLIFAASAYGYFHGVTLLSKTWETRLIFAKLIYISLLLNAIMDSVFLCITTVKRENLEL